uniref:NADH-ubiquinone oxidoreductase chain 2 n=1 Tax=Zeugopterus punctatus TaxID=526623 RepID=A0A7G9M2H8_9PLEU|nr:NADH dehydrogenase subunit 2 [Zeugopterus punctatus]QNM99546.1 NADH dehydrogenase subunit 2 [Zeugopterus punctatus]
MQASPFILSFYFLALGFGTILTLTSTHWFLGWMGLEIATIAILPLLAGDHHPRATEAALKYFMIQISAASLLLFACLLNAWLTGEWGISQETHPIPASMIIIALALKMGLSPLHAWLPEVLQGLKLTIAMVVVTWQKLAPIALLYQMELNNPLLFSSLAIMSMITGAWGALNQTQLRKILAYSSIAHLGWVVLILQFSTPLALLALFTYFILTIALFLILNWKTTLSINALASSSAKTPLLMVLTPLVLLSLGGLPPLTGFAPKWLTLLELTKQSLPLLAVVAALTSLLSLYFYFRLMIAAALFMAPSITAYFVPSRLPSLNFKLPAMAFVTAAILLMPVCPTLFTTFIMNTPDFA